MGLGVVVIVLAFVDLCPYFLSKTLEWSLFVIDKIIHNIASLEQFIFKDKSHSKYAFIQASINFTDIRFLFSIQHH